MGGSSKEHIQFLWQSFLDGDDRAFAVIYQQHIESLIAYGNKFNIDLEAVQDALQEIFVDLYLKRNQISIKIENLKGYLFIALKNNLLKKINRQKKIQTSKIDDVQPELQFDIEYSFQDHLIQSEIANENKQKLKLAIENLSAKQKEIIYLKFEEELDYHQIAKILDITIESARKQLYRTLKSLRESIDYKTFKSFLLLFSKKN